MLAVGAIALLVVSLIAAPLRAADKPNFVFILVDDLGWADVGCNGSSFYETPNVDRLAAGGMRFTDAYAACPVCSPTRASILTGKYPARLKLTNYLVGLRTKPGSPILPAPYKHQMELSEVTIAEALKTAGYACGHVGKWHLGDTPFLPEKQGFDLNVAGTRAGMPRSFFYPRWKENVPLEGKEGDYLPDRLTEEALEFIEDCKDKPFFLYLAFYDVHIPIEGKPGLIAKYEQKGRDPARPQNNAHYAAMVESMDHNVGRVLDKLEALGLDERTVVFFTSDNGGLSVPEGPHTPATSNHPLRAGKGHLHEGGIREPLVIRAPGRTEPGSVCREAVGSIDFYPTILELAGAEQPREHMVDGVSLAPLLAQKGELDREALYWHYPHFSNQGGMPGGAVRAGDFKLIEFYEDGALELYNLKDDLGETKNLAGEMPEKAKELQARLAAWRKSVDATMPPPSGQAPGAR
jgi:arylsulfatase A-like enzyme